VKDVDVLQLLGEVFICIVIVPALLPQMRIRTRHLRLLGWPICGSKLAQSLPKASSECEDSRGIFTLYWEVFKLIVLLQRHIWLLLIFHRVFLFLVVCGGFCGGRRGLRCA
jgi:hypothetical protein